MRGILLKIVLVSVGLLAMVIIAQLVWWSRGSAPAVGAWLERVAVWFGLWRCALFIGLIGFWSRWTRWLAERYDWSVAQQTFMSTQRWRFATWLIVIELVLVQNVAGRFISEVIS